MGKLDFAQGYKTIAGIIVLALSLTGSQVSQDEVMMTVSAIGQVIGELMMIYGMIMKIYRSTKK